MVTLMRKSLFERLRTGLEEGIAFAKGELDLRRVEIPQEPPENDATTQWAPPPPGSGLFSGEEAQ
jgi:hypothetical protein